MRKQLADPRTLSGVSWTEAPTDTLADFVVAASSEDQSLETFVGAQTGRWNETISIPLIVQFCHVRKQTNYRRGAALTSDRADDAIWIEVDPRMTLKRALELFGTDNLVAYEKTVDTTTLEILVLPVVKRDTHRLRILVHKPK